MKLRSIPKKIADWFKGLLPENILLYGMFIVIFLYLVYISPIFLANYLTPCQGQLFGAILGTLIMIIAAMIRGCRFQGGFKLPKLRLPKRKV